MPVWTACVFLRPPSPSPGHVVVRYGELWHDSAHALLLEKRGGVSRASLEGLTLGTLSELVDDLKVCHAARPFQLVRRRAAGNCQIVDDEGGSSSSGGSSGKASVPSYYDEPHEWEAA
ncbi:hypothetical protein VTK73DRAFT_2242 [Phialemonium thermophilum]|uniref:Uncharacterized protein n=1 Tax=Phialemonium thermophilum TaxID=223376 RepID=A0ABR3VSE0_9PEZI